MKTWRCKRQHFNQAGGFLNTMSLDADGKPSGYIFSYAAPQLIYDGELRVWADDFEPSIDFWEEIELFPKAKA